MKIFNCLILLALIASASHLNGCKEKEDDPVDPGIVITDEGGIVIQMEDDADGELDFAVLTSGLSYAGRNNEDGDIELINEPDGEYTIQLFFFGYPEEINFTMTIKGISTNESKVFSGIVTARSLGTKIFMTINKSGNSYQLVEKESEES